MNRYSFLRNSLLEIYEKRDGLIKILCEEIDKSREDDSNTGRA